MAAEHDHRARCRRAAPSRLRRQRSRGTPDGSARWSAAATAAAWRCPAARRWCGRRRTRSCQRRVGAVALGRATVARGVVAVAVEELDLPVAGALWRRGEVRRRRSGVRTASTSATVRPFSESSCVHVGGSRKVRAVREVVERRLRVSIQNAPGRFRCCRRRRAGPPAAPRRRSRCRSGGCAPPSGSPNSPTAVADPHAARGSPCAGTPRTTATCPPAPRAPRGRPTRRRRCRPGRRPGPANSTPDSSNVSRAAAHTNASARSASTPNRSAHQSGFGPNQAMSALRSRSSTPPPGNTITPADEIHRRNAAASGRP